MILILQYLGGNKYMYNNEQEIRNKAISDFAEQLKLKYQCYDIDLCFQDNDHLSYTNSCIAFESFIDEIAKELKG
jgi:hypothetical protein